MKKFFASMAFVGASLLVQSSHAVDWIASVYVNPRGENVEAFMCHATTFYSDVKLDQFHGCDVTPITYGPRGDKANILAVYHGWKQTPNGNTPKVVYFIERPDGELYRVVDDTIFTSPRLTSYFDTAVQRIGRGATNIGLKKYSQIHLQHYGNQFCIEHHLKHPFKGIFGWCQGDTIISGSADYMKGALTYTRAALLAQDYMFDNGIPLMGMKILGPHTITALNQDINGWLYYAFAAPGTDGQWYNFRVYFNGTVQLVQTKDKPKGPEVL